MKRYHLTFRLEKDEETARRFCEMKNREMTPYARKKYPAHHLPYQLKDFDGFICLYYYGV